MNDFMNSKLVLFDIDDTLVEKKGSQEFGMIRWQKAMYDVYGVDIDTQNHPAYDGWVDYQIGAELSKRYGIALDVYEQKFPLFKKRII